MLVIHIHNFYSSAHLDQTSASITHVTPHKMFNNCQARSSTCSLALRHKVFLNDTLSNLSIDFLSCQDEHEMESHEKQEKASARFRRRWIDSHYRITGFNELLLEIIFNSFSLFHYIPEKLSMTRRKKENDSIESSSTPKLFRLLCQDNWALQTLYRCIFYFDAARSPDLRMSTCRVQLKERKNLLLHLYLACYKVHRLNVNIHGSSAHSAPFRN